MKTTASESCILINSPIFLLGAFGIMLYNSKIVIVYIQKAPSKRVSNIRLSKYKFVRDGGGQQLSQFKNTLLKLLRRIFSVTEVRSNYFPLNMDFKY